MANNNEATLILKIKDLATSALEQFNKRFVITAGDIVNLAKKIGGAIVDFVGDAVAAYKEEELAINTLTQAMLNQGIFTQDLRAKYLKLADSIQEVTKFSDDQIISAQAVLQTYMGNKRVTEELVRATLDLAAAKNTDLQSAATAVGKAIRGETDTLMREKIAISESATEGERYAAVLNKIQGDHKGVAEAQAKGLGSLDLLKNAWNDFLSNAGRALAPLITQLAQATTAVLTFFNSFADPSMAKMDIDDVKKQITKVEDEIKASLMRQSRLGSSDTTALDAELARLKEHLAKMEQERIDSSSKSIEDDKVKREEKRTSTLEQDLLDQEQEIANMNTSLDQQLAVQLAADNKKIDAAKTKDEKMQALAEKSFTLDSIRNQKKTAKEDEEEKIRLKNRADTLNTIATLQSSNNKTLAIAGKAAGIAQIAIATPVAISQAMASGIPFPGNMIAAGLVAAAMAVQAARIAGVQLAEGGIVMPTPGGTQATIGEGGQAEAVIPLDRAGEFGLGGGGTTINFMGPIMGNESQARELAIAIDRELLRLRQSNQSVSFETGVI